MEQKLLDKHHPTWAAKRSNNVGSSKVGTLNTTLFDSLARALQNIVCLCGIVLNAIAERGTSEK